MRIYLCGRFSKRHILHKIGRVLQAQGHEIVSRWTLPDFDHVTPTGMSEQAADAERERFAVEDLEDVEKGEWCISLMEEPRGNGRGGRHIEHAHAYCMLKFGIKDMKKITIIGPRETVFHHLPEIEHFDTVMNFLEAQPQEQTSE